MAAVSLAIQDSEPPGLIGLIFVMTVSMNIILLLITLKSSHIKTLNFMLRKVLIRRSMCCLTLKGPKCFCNVGAWLSRNAKFYETFICFYVSEAKPHCFSLCSQMFADVE